MKRYVTICSGSKHAHTHTQPNNQSLLSSASCSETFGSKVISRLIENTIDGWVRTLMASLHHQNLLNIRYWSHLKRHRLMNNNLLSITHGGCLWPMNSVFSLATRRTVAENVISIIVFESQSKIRAKNHNQPPTTNQRIRNDERKTMQNMAH